MGPPFAAVDVAAALFSWFTGYSNTADIAADLANAAITHTHAAGSRTLDTYGASASRTLDSFGASATPLLQRTLDSIGASIPDSAGASAGHCTWGKPSSFLEDPVCSQYLLQFFWHYGVCALFVWLLSRQLPFCRRVALHNFNPLLRFIGLELRELGQTSHVFSPTNVPPNPNPNLVSTNEVIERATQFAQHIRGDYHSNAIKLGCEAATLRSWHRQFDRTTAILEDAIAQFEQSTIAMHSISSHPVLKNIHNDGLRRRPLQLGDYD